MRAPLADLEPARRRRLLWVSLALWLLSGLAMLPLNAWLTDHGASIVDFELARDDAARYLDGWGDGTWRVTVSLILDYPFLVGYGVGSALLLLLLAGALERRTSGLAAVVGPAAWLPIAGAAFDAVENAFLLVVAADNTSTWPDLAALAATVKFVLLGLALVVFAVGLVTLGVLSARRRASPAPAP